MITALSMVAILGVVLDAVSVAGVLDGDAPGAGGASVARSTGSATPSTTRSASTGRPSRGTRAELGAGRPLAQNVPATPRTVRTVVGLGDSVPAGSACDCDAYVTLVGQGFAARQGTPVTAKNLSAAGLTTHALLEQLDDDATRQAVATSDVTIITIGANDFDSDTVENDECGPGQGMACYQDELARLRTAMDAVLSKVRSLDTRPGNRIVVTGYWNVFMDGATARAEGEKYVTNSDKLTLAVNRVLAASAAAAGARYVDLYAPFKGEAGTRDDTALLAGDGDHPDAAGHRLIAREILSALSS